MWFPEGTSLAANEAVVKRLEQRLMQEPGMVSVSTWVGSGVPRFYLPMNQYFSAKQRQPNDCAAAKTCNAREVLRMKLPTLLATEFPEIRGRAKLLPNGPPVHTRCSSAWWGPTLRNCARCADTIKDEMRKSPNTRGVNDNWNESVKVLRLDIDQAKARALGVTSQSIAQASRAIVTGSTVGTYREGDKLIDIVLRQPLEERNAITDLGNAYLPTASGPQHTAHANCQTYFCVGAGRDVARKPRLRHYHQRRHHRRPAGRHGDQRAATRPQSPRGQMANWLPHRSGRRGGRVEQRASLHCCGRAHHAVYHLYFADAAAAKLQPRHAGVS